MEKNNSGLFYTCSLIEYIGRKTKNTRCDIVNYLGHDVINKIYNYADVFHCEPIEKVADDFIERYTIPIGIFDNVSKCKYEVPDYWDIGEVFERLVEDCFEESEVIDGIIKVYNSWIASKILNFNSDLYYQPRDYIKMCYLDGMILA